MKFYVVDMLVNNLKRFFKIGVVVFFVFWFLFFFGLVRIRIYMETIILRFLTSAYLIKLP